MQIRRLDSEDWQLLKSVRLTALLDSPQSFSAGYEHEAEIDDEQWRRSVVDRAWFVAFDDDDASPIGLAAGTERDDHSRGLTSMWVHPAHRGSGVAGSLIAAVATWAKADGAAELRLFVVADNHRARRFYERHSFVPTGLRASFRDQADVYKDEMSLAL